MHYATLQEWLEWLKKGHSQEIDLSLDRIKVVASRLGLLKPSCPLITVAGTNGKGSCVAALQGVYKAAGYRVGAYTSPFLFRYNEQIALQGESVSDKVLFAAFQQIADALQDLTLTPFEFSTLAALSIFKKEALDVWILEVGLGGRYDAVNILPADVAIISTIALDHTEWLGNTREQIGYEKAGIFKPDCYGVIGDFDPPHTVLEVAKTTNTTLFCQNQQFGFKKTATSWDFWSEKREYTQLPLTALQLQNMATVLMAVELLQERLPMTRMAIDQALKKVTLPGRIQVRQGAITQLFDVSHNPAAIALLTDYLATQPISGKTIAVFSMLSDKDIEASLQIIKDQIDAWYVAPVAHVRGASSQLLQTAFEKASIANMTLLPNLREACRLARNQAKANDRIVHFGSFHTVSETYSEGLEV